MDPQIANDNSVPLQSEALEIGVDLEVVSFIKCPNPIFNPCSKSYLESRLAADTSQEHLRNLADRILTEPGSHADFAEAIRKVRECVHLKRSLMKTP